MIDGLFTLVVVVLLIGLAVWIIRALVAAFTIPEPIVTIIYVLLVLMVLFFLARLLGFSTAQLHLRL